MKVKKNMPGIVGQIHFGNSDKNAVVPKNELDTTEFTWTIDENFNTSYKMAKNTRSWEIFNEDKFLIIFEGTLLNHEGSKKKIAKSLYKKFKRSGELFVKDLRGSFQILVVDSRKISKKYYLYADHTASRPIFYSNEKRYFIFSPDIENILTSVKTKTIDEMALVHFLIAGHFPACHTAIKEIKLLGPGEYLKLEDKKVEKRKYYQFKIQPDEKIESQEAAKWLDQILTERIIEHWRHANSPAILLSGGYDSQYIFYTIADSIEDTSKLTTVTWGQAPEKRYADMHISRYTAKRFGTNHIEIVKKLNSWKSDYDEMFKAQNGLTASSFYHAQELSICKFLKDNHGIKSIIRGDECLGYGPDANTAQDALIANSMSYPEYITGLNLWFKSGQNISQKYSNFINNSIDKYKCNSYSSLKDTLDFYERQNMNRNPLNYYKLHYLDVFCPLIDVDILKFTCKLPNKYRRNKQLFKNILRKKIGKRLKIAEYTNLTNWSKVISESNDIKKFLRMEYEHLPEIMNYLFFDKEIYLLKYNERRNIKNKIKNYIVPIKNVATIENLWQWVYYLNRNPKQKKQIPPYMLLIRAAVLSRWNRLWIK